MIDKDNPHTTYTAYYAVSHFKDHVAVGANDDWDSAVFQHAGGFGGEYEVTSKVKYDRLKSLLDSVYRAGMAESKKRIREALGVRE